MSKRQNSRERNVAFWDEKGKQAGVEHIAPGVYFKRITAHPEGVQPGPDSVVTCHYSGTLMTGKVFDSTRAAKCPAAFRVKELIPGFAAALQAMHKGETARAFLRYDAAYGPKGDAEIPAFSTLIFDIELIDVK